MSNTWQSTYNSHRSLASTSNKSHNKTITHITVILSSRLYEINRHYFCHSTYTWQHSSYWIGSIKNGCNDTRYFMYQWSDIFEYFMYEEFYGVWYILLCQEAHKPMVRHPAPSFDITFQSLSLASRLKKIFMTKCYFLNFL